MRRLNTLQISHVVSAILEGKCQHHLTIPWPLLALMTGLFLCTSCMNSSNKIYTSSTTEPTMDKQPAITFEQHSNSPADSPSDTLAFTIESTNNSFMLYGFYNISTTIAAQYTQNLPTPIQVIAIERSTGNIFLRDLTREDDIPAAFVKNSEAFTIRRPDGSTFGISESGYFNVDLATHLCLPEQAGVFDVFLWLDDKLSPLVSTEKQQGVGRSQGSLLYEVSSRLAEVRPISKPNSDKLSITRHNNQLYVTGEAKQGPVSVVVFSQEQQRPAWTVIHAQTPVTFSIKIKDILPDTDETSHVMALAVINGKLLPLQSTR